MNKQTKGTGKVHQLHEKTKIEPLDGWGVQTKYGTLRLHDGTDCVRLEDVHSWMCSEGKPPTQAVYALFGDLLDAAGEIDSGVFERLGTLLSLRLVNARGTPVPVFTQVNSCRWDPNPKKCECMEAVTVVQMHPDGPIKKKSFVQRFISPVALSKSRDVQVLKQGFPSLGHVRFEDDTPGGFLYAMGEGAARVWSGDVDIQSDYLAAYDAKKSQESDRQHGIRWPEDEVLKTLLARLAVPVAVAYQLWGWGRVVADQVEAAPADPMTKDVGTPGKKTRYDWKGDQTLYCKLQSDFDAAKGATVEARREAVAAEWGISPAMVKKALLEGGKTAPVIKQRKASPLPT